MRKILVATLGLLVIHLFLLANLRFTAWPEMLSYPYLLNHGFALYKDFIHPYPPLLTEVLAGVYRLLGYKIAVLQIFTWGLILACDMLVYLIVKKLTKNSIFALLSLLFYIFIQPALEGNMLWFDLAIVPSTLAGVYFLTSKLNPKNLLLAGIFLAIAAFTKQTAGLFFVIAFIYLMIKKTEIKNLVWLFAGPVVGGTVVLVNLVQTGAASDFMNWVILYPFLYWSRFPGYVQMALSKNQAMTAGLIFLPLAGIFVRNIKALIKDERFLLLASFFAGSLVLIYPRFSFFHFQLALALGVVLTFYLVGKFKVSWAYVAAYGLFLIALIVYPAVSRDWNKEARFYGSRETYLSGVISQAVRPDQAVYLLGEHSGLYVLAGRLPPKPWFDSYVWYLEIPGVQDEILARWGARKPDYVFWSDPVPGNWFDLGTYQPKKITDWIQNNYNREGEIVPHIGLWTTK